MSCHSDFILFICYSELIKRQQKKKKKKKATMVNSKIGLEIIDCYFLFSLRTFVFKRDLSPLCYRSRLHCLCSLQLHCYCLYRIHTLCSVFY